MKQGFGTLHSKVVSVAIVALAGLVVASKWGQPSSLWAGAMAAVFVGTVARTAAGMGLYAQAASVGALILSLWIGGVHGALLVVLSDGPLLFALQAGEKKLRGRGTANRLLPIMTSMSLVIAFYLVKEDAGLAGVVLAAGVFLRALFFSSEESGSAELYPWLSEHHLLFFPGTALTLLSPEGNIPAAGILAALALLLVFLPKGKVAVPLAPAGSLGLLAPEAMPGLALAVLGCGWPGMARLAMIPLSILTAALFLPAAEGTELLVLPGIVGFAVGWMLERVVTDREKPTALDAAMGVCFIAIVVAGVVMFPKVQENLVTQPWPAAVGAGGLLVAFLIRKYGVKKEPSLEGVLSRAMFRLENLLFSREGEHRPTSEYDRSRPQVLLWNVPDDWLIAGAAALTALMVWGVYST